MITYYLVRYKNGGRSYEYHGHYNKDNYAEAVRVARLLASDNENYDVSVITVTEEAESVKGDFSQHMEPKELAELLNGREYGREMTRMEEQLAKDFGLVVVFGASDDLMEFRGCIDDEADCWNGGEIAFTKHGLHWKNKGDGSGYWVGDNKIEAQWCKGKTADGETISWTYKTSIPHADFMVLEDEEPYCRGIVFKLDDLV